MEGQHNVAEFHVGGHPALVESTSKGARRHRNPLTRGKFGHPVVSRGKDGTLESLELSLSLKSIDEHPEVIAKKAINRKTVSSHPVGAEDVGQFGQTSGIDHRRNTPKAGGSGGGEVSTGALKCTGQINPEICVVAQSITTNYRR